MEASALPSRIAWHAVPDLPLTRSLTDGVEFSPTKAASIGATYAKQLPPLRQAVACRTLYQLGDALANSGAVAQAETVLHTAVCVSEAMGVLAQGPTAHALVALQRVYALQGKPGHAAQIARVLADLSTLPATPDQPRTDDSADDAAEDPNDAAVAQAASHAVHV